MAENSKIEWTDHTFNPWIGCTKVSPGCDHCYAEAWDRRFAVSGQAMRWGTGKARTRTAPGYWRQPLRWNAQAEREGRRYRVFCASLADVFDNEVQAAWRVDLFALIERTPNLDWLLLTKRIGNAANMMFEARGGHLPLLPNVWIGASIVNQGEADRDIPKLLAVPAAKRFLSMEPLLGPVDLTQVRHQLAANSYAIRSALKDDDGFGLSAARPRIDWVIVGGESGPHARPMHPAWARSLRDQCNAAGVPFFFKQWGEWADARVDPDATVRDSHRWPINPGEPPSGVWSYKVGKQAAGRLLDGRTWDEVPS